MNTLILLALLSGHVSSKCPDLYPQGVPIGAKNTVELCSIFFVVVYDPVLKANVFSAEKIVGVDTSVPRVDSFRTDTRLPATQRAELSDYSSSGYDRGHMAPAADTKTAAQMRETFRLSNMTPQAKKLNEGPWKVMEESVRAKFTSGTSYVITGAVYAKTHKTIGANQIPVPKSYYKCAWYGNGTSECFKAENTGSAAVLPATFAEINASTGLNLK